MALAGPSKDKRQWVTGLALLGAAHLAAVALFAPGSELSVTFGTILLVSVILPWLMAGGLLAISSFPEKGILLVAIGVPVAYFTTWAIGAFVVLSTGALPK